MTAILRDAIKPNLLQTLEHTPVLVHAGPFGNIATGNSSVRRRPDRHPDGATSSSPRPASAPTWAPSASSTSSAGSPGCAPDAAVLVATVRALKAHSGRYDIAPGQAAARPSCSRRTPTTSRPAGPTCASHIEIVRALRRLAGRRDQRVPDRPRRPSTRRSAQIAARGRRPRAPSRRTSPTAVPAPTRAGRRWSPRLRDEPATSGSSTPLEAPLRREDRDRSRREIYGADGIDFAAGGGRAAARGTRRSATARFPVVIAKTHLSSASDPTLLGAPTGWRLPVREVRAAAGAGYVYAICGDMRTMPGLRQAPGRRAHRHRRRRQRRRPVLTPPASARVGARVGQGLLSHGHVPTRPAGRPAVVVVVEDGGPAGASGRSELDRDLVHLVGRVTGLLVHAHDGLAVRPGHEAEHLAAGGVEPDLVIADALGALDVQVPLVRLLRAAPCSPRRTRRGHP